MRDRIAENPETNWWSDIGRDLMPILEIGKSVDFFCAFSFHVVPTFKEQRFSKPPITLARRSGDRRSLIIDSLRQLKLSIRAFVG
jgi:hypothetical protein